MPTPATKDDVRAARETWRTAMDRMHQHDTGLNRLAEQKAWDHYKAVEKDEERRR